MRKIFEEKVIDSINGKISVQAYKPDEDVTIPVPVIELIFGKSVVQLTALEASVFSDSIRRALTHLSAEEVKNEDGN